MNNNHFTSSRPAASLDGYGYAIGGATIESKLMDIAADRASQHPFADVSTNGSNLKQTLITVLQPRKATQSSIPVHFMQTDNVTSIVAGELRIDVTDAGSIPEFQIV